MKGRWESKMNVWFPFLYSQKRNCAASLFPKQNYYVLSPNSYTQCCGSGMFIPDPGSDFFPSRIRTVSIPDPGSRILIKEFKYFNPKKAKKWFLSSKKYDPGCSSRIPDPGSGCWLSPIPDPRSRGQKSTQSRIPDPDPQHCLHSYICERFIYISKIGLSIFLQPNMWTDPGNIYKSLTDTWM